MVESKAQAILRRAHQERAQDVYIVPQVEGYSIYLRLGEERVLLDEVDLAQGQALLGHFKFAAGMNVGERRRSQLGSCDYALEQDCLSLRLSTVGDYRGLESLVIRLLYDGQQPLAFWDWTPQQLSRFIQGRGLYLFSGPVGSGKTSLMYQLAKTRFQGRQILTIEDPVEIKDPAFLQLQLNKDIGMTYDHLIKLSLRHRPDLLIIGEIRDTETARAVIRAALTGISIFSTVHARSIPGVYARLLELEVEPGELAESLRLVAYQRLIGGKGLVDVAQKEFAQHPATSWNQKVTDLLEAGVISQDQAQAEYIGAPAGVEDCTTFP
ncbi:Flp pilus assembly complex ATPase component TadA [Streptococcus danieliae]|uniref:Flp pilus assembly complex ATPase component TadA n=1 Tax=Streptococcus danieliae TaxID=747656 RepID=A0A7Z0LCQ1_9STRE|nr:competence type IV pilus ATPase ComGA [Streptococcus danieliae]MBF0717118.1 Flp pilus assembly complex ATPase component TadA [Streptococcus danieliae]NYS49048.1 Flp pilus assembly complex ATPase component TadA [Streptococcus danieliae]